MKGSLRILGLVVATFAARGEGEGQPTAPDSGPRLRFAELMHDFGRIDERSVVRHDFVFTNAGNAVLQITDVKPGCGCTTAGTWDRSIEPGRTGTIPLQFNSTGFSGSVAKIATVTCNDPTQANFVLQLRATVWRAIEVAPASAYFNVSSEAPTNDTRVVRIVNNLEAPLTLSEPECTNRSFRVELGTIKPGKEFELRVTVVPPFASPYAQASIKLKTSSTNTPMLSIPVYATVQPVIQVMPSQIVLPAGPLAGAIQPSVTIRNTGTNVLALSEATINLHGAGVNLKEVQPGRVFTLMVNIPAGVQLQATQRVEVTLKSNHPKFPEVRVPVLQQQAQRPPAAATLRPAADGIPPLLARPVTVPAVSTRGTNGPAGGASLETP